MSNVVFLRDKAEAEGLVGRLRAAVGRTDKWGRITCTLLGVEMEERERGGRPLYVVLPVEHNHDPLFDGNLPRVVREARAAYAKRGD